MAEDQEQKFTRETGDGFDIFRASQDKDDKPILAYVRQDQKIRIELDRYRLTASTLSANDASEAHMQSSDRVQNLGSSKGLRIPEPDSVTGRLGDVNHADIWLSVPLNMDVDVSLGLITSAGAKPYEGGIELCVHIGLEEHSHVVHYESVPTERLEECVFFSAYISRERMEWLHRELASRPNAILMMRGSIYAFKAEGGWQSEFPSLFDEIKRFHVEPGKATRLSDVSFDVRDPEIGSTKHQRHPINAALDRAREKWVQDNCNPERENSEPWQHRCANALAHASEKIAEWCSTNGETRDTMVSRLRGAQQFLQDLDAVLHDKDGPFGDEKSAIWQHVNFQPFLKTTKPSQREGFVALYNFIESADEYIAKPHLQNDYLDWLLLDVMTAQKAVAIFEAFMTQKHGMAYALFGAVHWKLLLWKLTMRPLALLFGWVLPIVGFYFIAQWSLWLGIGLAVVYYGFSLLMLSRWLWYKLFFILTGTPSPLRRLGLQIEEMDRIYPLLAGPLIHVGVVRMAFERAADKGIIWDPRMFYLLDYLARRNPKPWRNSVPRSFS